MEIKYQAYVEKEIIEGYPASIYPVLGMTFNPQGGLVTVRLEPCDWIDVKWVELMQYSNRKDKDGIEIYSGSILQARKIHRQGINIQGYPGSSWNEDCDILVKSEVVFDGLNFRWRSVCNLSEIGLHYHGESDEMRLDTLYNHSEHMTGHDNETYTDFKVIGNIHLNKDLLE